MPGSHKSNYAAPDKLKQFEWTGPWLRQVPQKAGSAVIFTEALTHGAWPWTVDTERRSLLYKYSPGHMAWSHSYPASSDVTDSDWSADEERILEPPYIGQQKPVREPS